MLKIDSLNIEGKSQINDITVVGFNSSFPLNKDGELDEDKIASFSQIVFDEKSYTENKSQCDSDFELFKKESKSYKKISKGE